MAGIQNCSFGNANVYATNPMNGQVLQQNSHVNSQNKLERNPEKDTVSLSKSSNNQERVLGDMDVNVSNGFLGMGKRTIKGKIAGKAVDLKLDTGTFNDNVKLTGTINGKPVELKLKDYKLTGNLSDEDNNLIPYLKMIMSDKRAYDNNLAMMAMAV